MYFKGVCWSPVDIGNDLRAGEPPNFSGRAAQDAALMRAAGINSVRTYEPLTDTATLDLLYAYGISVVNTVLYSTQWGVTVDDVVTLVRQVGDHPAVVAWGLFNEPNVEADGSRFYTRHGHFRAGSQLHSDYLRFATAVKAADPERPIVMTWGEGKAGLPDAATISDYALVDIFGFNVYRGATLGDVFGEWSRLSKAAFGSIRPLLITEYGMDSLASEKENQAEQASTLRALSMEIVENSVFATDASHGVASGGFVFEWNDEWWKAGRPSLHDTSRAKAWLHPAYSDPWMHEEWFGVVDIHRKPKLAHAALRSVDNPMRSSGTFGSTGSGASRLRKISLSSYALAKCNDGSDAAFYFRPASAEASAKTWIMQLDQGGWCYDEASCQERCGDAGTSSDRALCGSTRWPSTYDASGIFHADHPLLRDANLILVGYCSSDAFMASTEKWGRHFRGLNVVQAVLQHIVRVLGLGSRSDGERDILIFGGSSAGGRGAMVHLDRVAEMLGAAAASTRVVGFLDSALWLDLEVHTGLGRTLAARTRSAYRHFDVSSQMLGMECARAYVNSRWRCLLGEFRLGFISSPVLVVQSQFDTFLLGEHGVGFATEPDERAYAVDVAERTRATLSALSSNSSVAFFAPACYGHAGATRESSFRRKFVDGMPTQTMEEALARLVGIGERVRWMDECTGWACGAGCQNANGTLLGRGFCRDANGSKASWHVEESKVPIESSDGCFRLCVDRMGGAAHPRGCRGYAHDPVRAKCYVYGGAADHYVHQLSSSWPNAFECYRVEPLSLLPAPKMPPPSPLLSSPSPPLSPSPDVSLPSPPALSMPRRPPSPSLLPYLPPGVLPTPSSPLPSQPVACLLTPAQATLRCSCRHVWNEDGTKAQRAYLYCH